MNGALRRSPKLFSTFIVILPLACAGWQRVTVPVDTVFADRQQIQIWRGAEARVFHAVRSTPDSLFGVPFQKPPSCDSCRVALARDQVDSLRLGNQEVPGVLVGMLPIVAYVALLLSLRGVSS